MSNHRRKSRGGISLIPLTLLLSLFHPSADAASRAELRSARAGLEAARDALSTASAEFRTLQTGGGLSRAEAEDYLAYLGRLERSVLSGCITVMQLKQELDDWSPEPGCNQEGMRPPGPVSFDGELTEEERVANLDGELGNSMSEFDEMLLREMDELQRKRSGSPDDAGRSGAGAAGGADGASSAAGGGEAGESAEPGEEYDQQSGQGEGQQSDRQDGRQAGGQQQTETEQGEGRPQGDADATQTAAGDQRGGVHGGSRQGGKDASQTAKRDAPPAEDDDDIVARQLREAAEKETDPELREKLWEEYRRYKQQQTAQSKQSKNLN